MAQTRPPRAGPTTGAARDGFVWRAERALKLVISANRSPLARSRAMAKAGITGSAASLDVLHFIDENPGLGISQLVPLVGVGPSTLSRHVSFLLKAGLVTRADDPNDGRAMQIRSTREGKRILAKWQAVAHGAMTSLVDGWTTDEIDTFATLLERLVAALGEQWGLDILEPPGA